PVIERIVEYHQIIGGRFLKKIHSIQPDKIGALPIATTVPTATPVMVTAEKNNGWYIAIHNEAKMTTFKGQFLRCNLPVMRTIHRSEEHTSELQSRFDLVC